MRKYYRKKPKIVIATELKEIKIITTAKENVVGKPGDFLVEEDGEKYLERKETFPNRFDELEVVEIGEEGEFVKKYNSNSEETEVE